MSSAVRVGSDGPRIAKEGMAAYDACREYGWNRLPGNTRRSRRGHGSSTSSSVVGWEYYKKFMSCNMDGAMSVHPSVYRQDGQARRRGPLVTQS